jgi:hypothetical protein
MTPRRFIAALLVALALLPTVLLSAPSTLPATQPATRPAAPATAPSASSREIEKKVAALTRKSIQLFEQSKLDEAEAVLIEALKLDPTHTTNLYNFACLMALRGKSDNAMIFLEKAAEHGWADFVHLSRDPDLKNLRDLPRYKQFVAKKDQYQRKAAEMALATLKKQFGDGYLYELDETRKLIFATNTDASTLAELKHSLQAQSASQWEQLFANKPDQFVSIVLPSSADFRKIVRMPGVGGFYNDTAKLLIVGHLGQTVTHEFTHALHAADVAPLGQEHPIWIIEGLASLFEAARFEGEKLVPYDNFRLNMLQNAAKRKALIPLEKLAAMKQPEFVAKANLAYGQASSVMLYLYEQRLLRKWYDAYKTGFEKDATGRTAIEQVTGQTFAEFEKAWQEWMTKRPPVPRDTGANGVVIGAKLGDANDGLKVESVLPDGPASRAGVQGGDLIVGVADAAVRDYDSFVPLLLQFKAGDKVTLKVRREGKYLELPLVLAKRSEVVDRVVNKPATKPATIPK